MSEQRVGKRAEQKRRWDRENLAECTCGNPMSRKAALCQSCERKEKAERLDARRKEIVALWARGLLLREIAASFGWPMSRMRYEFGFARAAGYDLPYRHNGYDRKAAA